MKTTYGKLCSPNLAGFRFDLGSLLQGQMWFFIPIMAYISLVIGRRGFGCEDNLQEIVFPKSFGGIRFDLRSLLQGQMWSLIPLMVYISLLLWTCNIFALHVWHFPVH